MTTSPVNAETEAEASGAQGQDSAPWQPILSAQELPEFPEFLLSC